MLYSGKHFADSFRTVRKNTLQIANEIPEDKYSFRATEDTRTVGETLAHIAAFTQMAKMLHGDTRQPAMSRDEFGAIMQTLMTYQDTLKSKDEIVAALEKEGEAFATWIESVDENVFNEVVTFGIPPNVGSKSRFEMLLGTKEHEMHHRGQLMLVERMLGIVPHLTRARMATR